MLSACPRWLIFVEGVGYNPGAQGMNAMGFAGDDEKAGYWWGGNLVGAKARALAADTPRPLQPPIPFARVNSLSLLSTIIIFSPLCTYVYFPLHTQDAPVHLGDMTKLVYSPHVYGPGVYNQDYFKAADFPNNMGAVWESHFGFVAEATHQPIVVGEMGGWYLNEDKKWQDWAIDYMERKGISLFYFALNPGSEDTGALSRGAVCVRLKSQSSVTFTSQPHVAARSSYLVEDTGHTTPL